MQNKNNNNKIESNRERNKKIVYLHVPMHLLCNIDRHTIDIQHPEHPCTNKLNLSTRFCCCCCISQCKTIDFSFFSGSIQCVSISLEAFKLHANFMGFVCIVCVRISIVFIQHLAAHKKCRNFQYIFISIRFGGVITDYMSKMNMLEPRDQKQKFGCCGRRRCCLFLHISSMGFSMELTCQSAKN